MKYLFTLLIVSFLSCNKSNDSKPKYDPPPTVTNVQASTDVAGGITRPKFTITLNVPDTAATRQFTLFVQPAFSIPLIILNPKSGTYTLVDTGNPYPLQSGKNTYSSFFLMADNSSIYNSTFTIN
jgi:hypothetical protein